jgi:hypothetical protein
MDLFAQTIETTDSTAYYWAGGFFILWGLILAFTIIIAGWKLFEKTGNKGWMSLIPVFNVYILIKASGRPGWWLVFFFLPLANPIASLIVSIDLAKKFNKDVWYGVLAIWLFSFIGLLMLGWGDAKYVGAGASEE